MKKIILLLMCALTSLVMVASPISRERARQAAERFVAQRNAESITPATAIKVALPDAVDADAQVAVYAVNLGNNEGFVLVGGNDLTDEIIGYCDHGTFDAQLMPANMRAWLESYVASTSATGNGNVARTKRAPGRFAVKTPIAPMLDCKWNQDAPYNDRCPLVGKEHAATGCTITAMAQVMYYHKWPQQVSTPIPGYTPDNSQGTNYPTLEALEATTFNWDKIYPTYNFGEDGTEVARLFIYLGTATQANYATETAVTVHSALEAMVKYFRYDASAKTEWRRQHSYDEWIDMLYAELQANRPVLFSGTATAAGHTFVVDGYDEEDFFHVNWGWGGMSDGYYKVVLMDPKEQGAETSSDSFSFDQIALFGVRPDEGLSNTPRLTVLKNQLLCADESGEYNKRSNESRSPYYENGYIVFPVMNSYNFNSITAEFDLGSRLVKNDGSVTRDFKWDPSNFKPDDGFDDHSKPIYLNPETDRALTDGDYKLYFTSKLKTADEWQLDEGSEDHYVTIHLDHAKRELTAVSVSNDPKLTLKHIQFTPATPIVNKPCEVTITVHNEGTGAYHGNLGLSYDKDGSSEWLNALGCDVKPGETATIKLSYTPKTAGVLKYNVSANDQLYNGSVTIVESEATDDCDLTITHKVTNAEGTEIPSSRAKLDVTVTNNSDKTYEGDIYVNCIKWIGENSDTETSQKKETIPPHTTVVLHRESPELIGALEYSFYTMYMKGEQEIEQDHGTTHYSVASYYTAYDAQGNATDHRLTSTLQPDATVCAVKLTNSAPVTSLNTSANPNMIIITESYSKLTGDNIIKGKQAENIKLTDGLPFYCPINFNAHHISYTRTAEATFDLKGMKGWSTIVLPFAATSCQATIDGVATPLKWYTDHNKGDIMLATYQYENDNTMEYGLPESSLMPCHPYLLGVPANTSSGKSLTNAPITFSADEVEVATAKAIITGRDYKMVGTFTGLSSSENIYVLDSEGAAFVPGAQSVSPFRAYFMPIGTPTPASKLSISLSTDTHSGINDIIDEQPACAPSVYYNLNGQRVTRPGKGIYIVDGKKVVF